MRAPCSPVATPQSWLRKYKLEAAGDDATPGSGDSTERLVKNCYLIILLDN
jgi:hypothetical protein